MIDSFDYITHSLNSSNLVWHSTTNNTRQSLAKGSDEMEQQLIFFFLTG